MNRGPSFRIYMAAFIMAWLSSFTIRFKVQGQDTANTRHRQCQIRGYQAACSDCTLSCHTLLCGRLAPDGHYVVHEVKPRYGVEDGTSCGVNKICRNKKCVYATPPFPIQDGEDIFSQCKPAQPLVLSYTRSQQCRDYGYSGVCAGHSTSCRILNCAREKRDCAEGFSNYIHQRVIPPLGVQIGTHCGPSHICVNGKCVEAIGEMPLDIGVQTVHECRQLYKFEQSSAETRDQQCKKYGFHAACESNASFDNRGCSNLYCGYEVFPGYYILNTHMTGKNREVRTSVATGTKCGESATSTAREVKVCSNRKCLPLTPRSMLTFGEEIYKPCHVFS